MASILATFPGASILRQTPGTLRSLVANATAEDMEWQPAPDRWSINMVLAHLADVELTRKEESAQVTIGAGEPGVIRGQ